MFTHLYLKDIVLIALTILKRDPVLMNKIWKVNQLLTLDIVKKKINHFLRIKQSSHLLIIMPIILGDLVEVDHHSDQKFL